MKKEVVDFHIHVEGSALQVEIETKNLLIKSYSEADFDNCVQLYGDEEITKYFDHGKPRSKMEVKAYVQERGLYYFNKREPFGLFSIFDKSKNIFIGQADLIPTGERGVVEIGCILHKQYQNQGLGTEAVEVLLFNYIEELNRRMFNSIAIPVIKVIGTVHPENYLSRSLIRKMGMRFDKFQERFGNPRMWFSLTVPRSNEKNESKVWCAEKYHNNSIVQNEAAVHVINQIPFKGTEDVLDIGCGDGKNTALIAQHKTKGFVLGIDVSNEMIQFAKNKFPNSVYNNLNFLQQDAQHLHVDLQFDIVFSSFAFQWIPDQFSLLCDIRKLLKPSGYLAVTIPLGISPALSQAIDELITSSSWKEYFSGFIPNWYYPEPEKFAGYLVDNRFEVLHQQTVQHKIVFPSRREFENYVFPWFPYFTFLPVSERICFFKQVIDRCLEIAQVCCNDGVDFTFPRLDIIARIGSFPN